MFKMSYAPQSTWTKVEPLGIEMHARAWFGPRTDRSPIVMVHGLGLSSRSTVPLGRRLAARGYDVLAPDMPGFGKSPKPAGAKQPAGPNVREQADQLLMWMDACGISRATLFGNSVGSQVVTDLAVRFPHRVDRLILKGPAPDPKYRNFPTQYARAMINMPYEAPSFNAVLQLEYSSGGMVRMVQHGIRTVDDRIETKLPHVQARTLVIRGENDKALSQEWAEEVARLLPDSRMAVIHGAAHNVQYTAPEVTARLMDQFLHGRLDDAATRSDNAVPRLDPTKRNDPLAPPKPLSSLAHGIGDVVASALYFILPRLVRSGPRTRQLMTMTGAVGTTLSLCTDYECGVVKKVPLPVHLNADVGIGLKLMIIPATLLRGEPLPGRLAMAAMGAFELLSVATTRIPTGPARLVPVARPARLQEALNEANALAAAT
jgi:pimeloyl-ACP methyl ester carboxylesterase